MVVSFAAYDLKSCGDSINVKSPDWGLVAGFSLFSKSY
ncbi:hypothetical protein RLON56S_03426 [Alishewanella longhuensis]